ncbi:uncharacterized protein JCM6883_006276 [Sporobolomyces salmoneus]|uniref:uncharacterized protein n=1 Tax=Sporobolomyces salmoneus TaxID=183962 RepID=UPI00317E8B1D
MAKLASSGASTNAKQPLQPSLAFHSDSRTTNIPAPMSYAECVALLEDFNLESTHRLRTLVKQSEERLQQIERHWTDSINSLDDRVKNLRLERFVKEFDSNIDLALSQLVREQVGMRPMGIVEQSARKRKRFRANSPNSKNSATDDENDLFASTTSKKQRSVPNTTTLPPSAQKANQATAPLSVTRNGSVIKKVGSKGMTVGSPTSSRKPARLRLRPSTSQTHPPPSASASSNFIYRNPLASSSSHTAVAPTPQNKKTRGGGGGGARDSSISVNASSMKTISRKPRRGESIVIRSLNDSPLGEFVAEESEDLSEVSSDTLEEEDADGEDWDMMDKNEASKIEDPQAVGGKEKRKNKLKGKGKPPQLPLSPSVSQAQTTRVPSSSSFGISLPANAPSYEELKKKWKEEMMEKLKGLEQSGDLQKKGLEGLLGLL